MNIITKKESIRDIDTKIIVLLFARLEEQNSSKGLGVYLIQKNVNQSSSKDKISHNLLMEHLYKLQRRGFIQYDSQNFWMLTVKGVDTCEYLEDSIGSKFFSLKRKLYNNNK